ncbi:hypothetical protein FLAN108750_00980 [Flavobacterium antarcticum]
MKIIIYITILGEIVIAIDIAIENVFTTFVQTQLQ